MDSLKTLHNFEIFKYDESKVLYLPLFVLIFKKRLKYEKLQMKNAIFVLNKIRYLLKF